MANENGGNGRKDATPAYPEDEDDQSARETVTGLSFSDRSEAEEADKNGEEEQIHKSRSPKRRKIPLELLKNENGGNGRKDATPAYPEDEDDQSARETVTVLSSPDRSEAEEADKNGEEEQIHKSRSPKWQRRSRKSRTVRWAALATSSWDAAYPTHCGDRAIRPTSPTPATIEIPENSDVNGYHATNSTIVEIQEKLDDDNANVCCFCFRK